MGILPPPIQEKPNIAVSRRRSTQTDFSKLGPLKAGGTIGFSTFRDAAHQPAVKTNRGRTGSGNDGDSEEDDDEEIAARMDDADGREDAGANEQLLNPDDARRGGELADGVRKIKVCPQNTSEVGWT